MKDNHHLTMAWLTKSLLEHHMESLSSEGIGRIPASQVKVKELIKKIKGAKVKKDIDKVINQLFLDSPDEAPLVVISSLKRLNTEKPILSDDAIRRLYKKESDYDGEAVQNLEIIKELQNMPSVTLELIRDLSRLYTAVLQGQEKRESKRLDEQGVASVLCGTLSTIAEEVGKTSEIIQKILSNHPSNPVLPLTSVQSQSYYLQSLSPDALVALGGQLFTKLDKEHITNLVHSATIENLRSEFKKQSFIILNSRKPEKEKEALNEVMNIITTLINFQSYITALNRKGHQVDGGFANGQKQPMPANPATQRPASPPPIPAHQSPPVPPERTTSKSSPTDAKPVPAPRSAPPCCAATHRCYCKAQPN